MRNDIRITDQKSIAVSSDTELFDEKSHFVKIRNSDVIEPSNIIIVIGRFDITAPNKPPFRLLVSSAHFTLGWRLRLVTYSSSLWRLLYIKHFDLIVNGRYRGCVDYGNTLRRNSEKRHINSASFISASRNFVRNAIHLTCECC